MFYFALIFYMVLDLSTFIVGIKDFIGNYSFDRIISTLTFTSVVRPEWLYSIVPGGWSISIEMLFYLLVPLLFININSIKKAVILVLASLFIGLLSNITVLKLNLISTEHFKENFLFYWFPSQFLIFCLGILLFYIWKKDISTSKKTINLLIILSLLTILILGLTTNIQNPYFPSHILFGISFMVFAYGLSKKEKSFLNNKVISFIGKISFSMYLVHFFVLDVLEVLFLEKMIMYLGNITALFLLFVVTAVITIFLSNITFKFIETPGIKIGRNLSKWINREKNFKTKVAK